MPPRQVAAYLRDLRRLYAKHGLRGAMYGHLGQGCVHSRTFLYHHFQSPTRNRSRHMYAFQLAQSGSDRRALHTAQVIAVARQHGIAGVRGPRPERQLPAPPAPPTGERELRTGAAVTVGVASAVVAACVLRGLLR